MNENALSLPSKQTQFCSKWLDKHDEIVLFTGCSVILILSNRVEDATASDSWVKVVPLMDYKTGAREAQTLVGG